MTRPGSACLHPPPGLNTHRIEAGGRAPLLQAGNSRREPVAWISSELVASVETCHRQLTQPGELIVGHGCLNVHYAVWREHGANLVKRQQRMAQVVKHTPEEHVVELLSAHEATEVVDRPLDVIDIGAKEVLELIETEPVRWVNVNRDDAGRTPALH